ncbi:DUF397 domain-containing protein [Nocardiopsis sp. NPDC050513]|uniref:DUF397 domain-containing protein n=1 Tax=Nocardiopsis sp. NPDC050513 TaxID=3364338 RepID=UPI0037A4EF1E
MAFSETEQAAWHKSSHSGGHGGECVEASSRKSSYSGGGSGECVEVANLPGVTAVRDTQNRGLGHIAYPSAEWTDLLAVLKQ